MSLTSVTTGSTGGLLMANFDENLARHASASYDFGRTYASRKHSQRLLDMHNNHHAYGVGVHRRIQIDRTVNAQ